SACEEKLSQFFVEVSTDKKLYEVVVKTKASTPIQERLLALMRIDFEKNGMNLNDADLEEFKRLKTELAKLEAEFSKNLNEDQSFITVTEEELAGTTADFKGRLKKNKDGAYIVTTKSTDYTQIMDNASNPEVRKRMLLAYDN